MLTIFQMLNSHRWSVATVLNSVNLEYFHPVRTFYWTLFEHLIMYDSTGAAVYSVV